MQSQSEVNRILAQHERATMNPPEEEEKYWIVRVEITNYYSGEFYGTREHAEEKAVEYFKRRIREYDDQDHTVESEVVIEDD